jgi:hypothetical protein
MKNQSLTKNNFYLFLNGRPERLLHVITGHVAQEVPDCLKAAMQQENQPPYFP